MSTFFAPTEKPQNVLYVNLNFRYWYTACIFNINGWNDDDDFPPIWIYAETVQPTWSSRIHVFLVLHENLTYSTLNCVSVLILVGEKCFCDSKLQEKA